MNGLRQHGVDTRFTVWTTTHRIGLYWLEESNPPRAAEVLYDRADSAMCNISPEDIEAVLSETLRCWWHTTGITLAISPKACSTTFSLLQRVREAGGKISFDLNYRAKLWSYEEALRECHPVMQIADLLFLPLRDIQPFFGFSKDSDPLQVVERVRERYPQAVVVLTLGSDGAVAASPSHAPIHQRIVPVSVPIGRVGAGDAFVAGFLYAVLKGLPFEDALNWGVCTAAIKYTIPGDLPIIDRTQIERLLAGTNSALLR
jgi:2-dehydro-3-deoxygluconokinase